jgi:16S rRNA (cytidine1402-2'-O)-methyltransferase
MKTKYSVISLVSDAGTPCVSDPGRVLVRECRKAGAAVFGIPGASAVTLALSLSGFNSNRFIFEGFLPEDPHRRALVLSELTLVLICFFPSLKRF